MFMLKAPGSRMVGEETPVPSSSFRQRRATARLVIGYLQ
jgi:hypothetical protein